MFGKYFKRKIKVSALPIIETAMLKLRPFDQSDSERVKLLAGDEAIASGAINIPHPYLKSFAESWIKTHEIEFLKGNSLILAITKKETGILIGSIGLYINKNHQHAELGYWVGKEYWGNGHCSEAVSAVVNHAFEKLNLNKIFAYFISRNPASGKVLAKNNFTKEGFFRQHVKYHEHFEDIECFSLLKADHKKIQ